MKNFMPNKQPREHLDDTVEGIHVVLRLLGGLDKKLNGGMVVEGRRRKAKKKKKVAAADLPEVGEDAAPEMDPDDAPEEEEEEEEPQKVRRAPRARGTAR